LVHKRKRASGGGRKPKGEFTGKSATITTRIQPGHREALEDAARASGRSLSQELEFRLRASLQKPTGAQRRNQAIAYVIARVAEAIEKETGRTWLEDPFTGKTLLCAIQHFAMHFAARATDGSVEAEVPPGVKEAAAKMPAGFAKDYCTPLGLGFWKAQHLINEIVGASRPPGVRHNEWGMPIFFTAHEAALVDIGRDLGLGAKTSKGS
jgi:hypothetical protein